MVRNFSSIKEPFLFILFCWLVAATGSVVYSQALFFRQDFNAGPRPVSIAIGDFNRDNKLDLAVANSASNTVSVLSGNGDGTFQPPLSFEVGTNPSSVAVGDFNGDGVPDLAVTNAGSNDVSILLGNEDGGFELFENFPVGAEPRSVAVADFDGDGAQDLAVANAGSNDVYILLGNGDGTFQPAQSLEAVFARPIFIAIGDFNDDGWPDLAVVNADSNDVSILLGIGEGMFGEAQSFAVGRSPSSVAIGDFNDDGRPDLAVANADSNDVSILLGIGEGMFGEAQSFAVGTRPTSVAIGDFDLDNRQDLAVVNSRSGNVSILFGDGRGRFSCPNHFPVGELLGSVVSDDFNGDGKSDLAVSNGGLNSVSVLLNSRQVSIERITFTNRGFNSNVSISNEGNRMAFVSDRNLVGDNPDATPQIFLWIKDFGFVQITKKSGCSNDTPSISADGTRIAFSSDCDLVGLNPDRNREIFLAELLTPSRPPAIIQVTDTIGGGDVANIQPSLSKQGKRIAFSSSRDLVGGDSDGNHEIFLWTQGMRRPFFQITRSEGGDNPFANFQPSINFDGTRITFSSNRNLVGLNPDENRQIFLWTPAGGISRITPRTQVSRTPDIDNFQPSISSDGSRIAFSSSRDLVRGSNPNGDHQIFLAELLVPGRPRITQITKTTGGGPLANSEPSINATGTRIAFKSNRDFIGGNCDLNDNIFLWRERERIITQVTISTGRRTGIPNRLPSINAIGTLIGFGSRCDLINPSILQKCDGNEEVYQARMPP